MKTAIIELVGGIGNQMFIYVTAKRISEEKRYAIKFDPAYYSWWPRRKTFARRLDLDKFNVNLEIANEKEVRRLIWRTNNRYFNVLLKRYGYFSKNFRKPKDVFNDKGLKDIYMSGFERNLNYIEKNIKNLRKEFSLKEKYKEKIKNILEKIKKEDSVSINVRRGDLTEFKDGNILGVDHYKKTLKIIKNKIKNPRFYVFSDDIEWCKKNLDFIKPITFVEGNSALEDLEVMKNCKHNILANSSLSWWAGMLNENKNKIIIAPIKFYHRERHKHKKIAFPKEWILI